MTTKQAVTKTQAARDYLNAHPGARSRAVVAALDEQGIKITSGRVTAIKAMMMYENAAPLVEEPADTLTLEQIKMVAQAIKRIRSRRQQLRLRKRIIRLALRRK